MSEALSLFDMGYAIRAVYERGLEPTEFRASPRLYVRLLATSYGRSASCAGLLRINGVLHFFEVPISSDVRVETLCLMVSDGTVHVFDIDDTAAVVV